MKLQYAAPFLIPIFIGLMLPLLDFSSALSQSEPNKSELDVLIREASTSIEVISNEVVGSYPSYEVVSAFNEKANRILLTDGILYAQLLSSINNDGKDTAEIVIDHISIEKEEGKLLEKLLEKNHVGAINENLMGLWKEINKSVVASIISIDIWALLTLITLRKSSGNSVSLVQYPVLIMLLHILLLIANSTIANEYSIIRMNVSTVITMFSLLLAWFVVKKTIDSIKTD